VVKTWNADLMEAVISELPLSYRDVLLAEGGVGLLMVGDGWLLEAVRVFMLYPAPSPLDCIFSSSDSTHIYASHSTLVYLENCKNVEY
jgi:hypothetical protein